MQESKLPNHWSRIVCIGVQWNLSEQVGVPPGVGSELGHFEILGVGSESA